MAKAKKSQKQNPSNPKRGRSGKEGPSLFDTVKKAGNPFRYLCALLEEMHGADKVESAINSLSKKSER